MVKPDSVAQIVSATRIKLTIRARQKHVNVNHICISRARRLRRLRCRSEVVAGRSPGLLGVALVARRKAEQPPMRNFSSAVGAHLKIGSLPNYNIWTAQLKGELCFSDFSVQLSDFFVSAFINELNFQCFSFPRFSFHLIHG
jgi:hypothetical protein